MENIKNRLKFSLAARNALIGYTFILPFIIGFIAFMFYPMMQSLMMVFSEVVIDLQNHGFSMEFTGLANLNRVLLIDTEFNRLLVEEVTRMVLIVPAIIIFSFFIALLLNQKFKGRGFVRAVFFLPVILSSGIIVGLEANNSLLNEVSDMIRDSNAMRANVTGILEDILLSAGAAGGMNEFMEYIFMIVNQLHDIAMASGIQIIIFLSALQTIPNSMFEASRIEGATEWENFWKITFPMVSPLILVNVVYSVVDFLVRTDNEVMERIRRALLQQMEYGFATAMAWTYFLVVMVILGVVGAFISRRVYYDN